MISIDDTVEVVGQVIEGKKPRRVRGWNVSQTEHMGKRGRVVYIREIRGKPMLFDVLFDDGKTLGYEESHLSRIETSLADLSL